MNTGPTHTAYTPALGSGGVSQPVPRSQRSRPRQMCDHTTPSAASAMHTSSRGHCTQPSDREVFDEQVRLHARDPHQSAASATATHEPQWYRSSNAPAPRSPDLLNRGPETLVRAHRKRQLDARSARADHDDRDARQSRVECGTASMCATRSESRRVGTVCSRTPKISPGPRVQLPC